MDDVQNGNESAMFIDVLPPETVGQVLSELTVVDRLQCEGVNPRWKSIVSKLGWTEQKKLSAEIVFEGASITQIEKFNSESLVALFRRVSASLTELDFRSFSFFNNFDQYEHFQRFDLLPKLARLDIRRISLSEAVQFLPPTLIELHSSGVFDDHSLTALSANCPRLEAIHFSSDPYINELSLSVMDAFFGRCRNLKTIDLFGDLIPMGPNASLTVLAQLERLEELHLEDVKVFDDAALTAVVTGCPRLKSLKLADIGVSEGAIRELDQHPNLVDFELKNSPVLNVGIQKTINEQWKLKKFNCLRSRMLTDDSILREMLNEVTSTVDFDSSESINGLLQRGYLPILVKGLSSADIDLQFEAVDLIAITTAENSQQIGAVVEAGAVPGLIKLLESESEDVSGQSLWALTNIINTRPDYRDLCIQLGIIETFLKMTEMEKPIEIVRQIALVLKKICFCSELSSDNVAAVLSLLKKFIRNSDEDILQASIWDLFHITGGENDQIQLVVDSGILLHLVHLLDHSNQHIQSAALFALSNIASSGTKEQVQIVLDLGVLKKMPALFYHGDSDMAENIMRFLANIACNENWVQTVLDTGLVPAIIQLLVRCQNFREVAVKTVLNIASFGRSEHVHYLVDFGVIPPFCKLLGGDTDNDFCLDILGALKFILEKSHIRTGEVCEKIKRLGGFNKIKKLRNHQSENIKKVASEIIDKYFPPNEEQEKTSDDVNQMEI